MSLLNFESKDNQTPRNRKSLKLVFSVGALVGVVALGSTLAASINLNGGGPVEFKLILAANVDPRAIVPASTPIPTTIFRLFFPPFGFEAED